MEDIKKLMMHHRDMRTFIRTIDALPDINIRDNNGNTLLHEVCRNLALNTTQDYALLLLRRGIDVNIQNNNGETALLKLCDTPSSPVLSVMLSKKRRVNPNLADIYGDTPLHIAAKHGNLFVVKRLIQKGAKVNVCNRSGETPLHNAAWMGCHLVADYLISHGADMNVVNREGQTPLYMSCIYSGTKQTFEIGRRTGIDTFDTAKLLTLLGADTSIRTNKGEVAFDRLTPERTALLKQLQCYPDNPVLKKLGRRQVISISKALLIRSISQTQGSYCCKLSIIK